MRFLTVINKISKTNKDAGFSLPEMLVVTIMVGILSAISIPNFLDSQREAQSREVFEKIRSALYEAQANAERKSDTCTVNLSSTSISGSPVGCVLENTTINTSLVSVTRQGFSTAPTNISFSLDGSTGNADTLYITRKKSGQPMQEVARCIVISPTGMIRTGFYDVTVTGCANTENLKYVP